MIEDAFEVEGADRPGRWLVTCDHATNRIPEWVEGGDLGLSAIEMNRHIAIDVGAAGVARALAKDLDSTAVLSRFSRLVIDPNRGLDDPTLLMRLYDGSVIPGNARADDAEKARRINGLYAPYHSACASLAGRRADTVLCAVHSFTPQLNGRPLRPWEIGILFVAPNPLAEAVIEKCREKGWNTGANEPYSGHLPGDSIDRHAIQPGRANVLVEIRHDLIATPEDQVAWAQRLAPVLRAALHETEN